MGQKVNPHGIRVGVIKDWDSRWFASKKDFSDNLVEDHKIRTELKAQLKDAGVPKIEIERTVDPSTSAPRVTVNIYCAKPGMVIGKGGERARCSAEQADHGVWQDCYRQRHRGQERCYQRSAGCRGHRSSAGEPRYLPPAL